MRFSIDDRKLLWVALIVAAFWFREPLAATLLPFILALALASLLEPMVGFLQSRARLPRPVAALVSLVLFVVAGGYVLLMIFTKVVSELVQMGSLLQRYQRVPVDFATYVIERLNELNELFDQRGLPLSVQQNIIQTVENLASAAVNLATQGINVVLNAMSQVPYLVVVLVISFIATYFLVKDRDRLVESAISLSPLGMRDRVRDAWARISADILGFFKATLILVSITVIMVALGLIAIGINYWMTLAIIAGILDLIPVLGPGFLFVPWAIGAATLGHVGLALQLLVLYALTFLVRQLFQAKILGDSIGIHPLWMLVVLYGGIQFFGLYGFIVAPVLIIVGKAVYDVSAKIRA